jgi:hypothetical protein
MVIYSLSPDSYLLTNSVFYSTNGYPTRVATTTDPAGDGVVALGQGGALTPQWLDLFPVGHGSDDATFTLKVLLWYHTQGITPGTPKIWFFRTLGEWTCTLGTCVGVAGSDLDNTVRFADTITMTGGPTLITNAAAPTTLTAAPIVEKWFNTSPTGNVPGTLTVPALGARKAEVIFSTGGSATDCNALWGAF